MRARTREDLNLRRGPGTDHPVLVILPSGTTVEVLQDKGTWWQVETLGLVGWVHRGFLLLSDPPQVPDRESRYSLGDSTLAVLVGDITDSPASVIVSSDDYRLSMGGGVSAAIAAAGGNSIRLDAAKKVPAEVGEVVVTSAGALPAQYIFHAITIGPGSQEMSAEELVKSTTRRCINLLDVLGLNSIAFPAIGAGLAGSPPSEVVAWMAEVLASALTSRETALDVSLYLWPAGEADGRASFSAILRRVVGVLPQHAEVAETRAHTDSATDDVRADASLPSDLSHRRQLLARQAALQQEQEQVEQALATASGGTAGELRARLESIVDQRVDLARRLKELPKPGVDVFISYAREDAGYREGLSKALAVLESTGRIRLFHDRQITAGADWDTEIQEHLESADLVVLLLSADFLSSKYIDAVEMKRARERYERGELRLVPIVVRHCAWDLTWLKTLNALPIENDVVRPVSDWANPDEAYTSIAKAIDRVIGKAT